MRVCAAQADGTGGEEQLQTVTVPLHKVRIEKEKWYDSMLDECNRIGTGEIGLCDQGWGRGESSHDSPAISCYIYSFSCSL